MKRGEKLRGDKIGEALQELIALPAEKQPTIAFLDKSNNRVYEEVEVVPGASRVEKNGKKIAVGIRKKKRERWGLVRTFFWNAEDAEGDEKWSSEEGVIEWLMVCD